MKDVVLFLLRCYQNFSRTRLPRCRYYPSCSQYCYDAVSSFGAFRGMYMGTRRLLRCHPFHRGGYDPVPENNR